MLLGFGLYLSFAFAGVVGFAIVAQLIEAFDGGAPVGFWAILPVMLVTLLLPFQFVLQAVRNYRQRPH